MAIKSIQELYDDFIAELQAQAPQLTDTNDGSIIDILAGVTSYGVNEITRITLDEFAKTFFSTAHGPEVTGGPDDLQTLAVDHFGDLFARPAAAKATGSVTFSRPTTGAGNVTIPIGTIVKTAPNANGVSQRFQVTAAVTMTGLSISASVEAIVAGTAGNVLASKVNIIESTLTDSTVTVNNASAMGGGTETETDAEYRETIRLLIETLRGATLSVIEAKALTVAGVEEATAVEFLQYVNEINISNNALIGEYFSIPRVYLYIADVNGTASGALLEAVQTAVDSIRAAGVRVDAQAAVALSQNWTATISLNPGGPNYATLQTDTTMLEDDMTKYIQDLAIGADFVRATANAYMLAKWGPSGTNDLVTFTTSVPSGDVSTAANQKLIPGTMSIV
jgi:hypothetical protein